MRLGTPAERPPMDLSRVEYEFAVLRVVPHVHLGAFVNVGVVLHVRRAGFLTLRVLDDPALLRARLPDVDAELLPRYLRACTAICAGDVARGGPVALAPTSERFHWLTAPRSDVLQSSPVHEGVCDDAERELDMLYRKTVFTPYLPQHHHPERPG
jgi:hypothetical protein